MIDTVQLRHSLPLPSPRELIAQGWTPIMRGDIRWTRNLQTNESLPRLTWRRTPIGSWLTAEISLPKLLYTNNVRLITDADVAHSLEKISHYISGIIQDEFDAATAIVGRIDYCFNFNVGEANIASYISLVASVSVPYMTRSIVEETTAIWKNKSKEITVYGKHAEVAKQVRKRKATQADCKSALGLLRVEVRLKSFYSIGCLVQRYKLPDRKAQNMLSCRLALQEIASVLRVLGLDRKAPVIDERFDMLREKYGDTENFRKLVAFLALHDRYGERFWKRGIGNYSPSTIHRYLRDLKDANVRLSLLRELPPLYLPQLL